MKKNKKPFFLITIDTEGDNLWAQPKNITTRNAEYIPRFQNLCEYYGFKPTYLVNYEMACSNYFKEFGLDVLKKEKAEIGMHLHAWNSPPLKKLTENDFFHQPYLIEYSKELINDKIKFITSFLENQFDTSIVSHRSGRWALNKIYSDLLIENGYKVDCSVTPLRSWSKTKGDPNGKGGSNYLYNINKAYWMYSSADCDASPLLEVPVTIIAKQKNLNTLIDKFPFSRKLLIWLLRKKIKPIWLRPTGKNISDLKLIIDYKISIKSDYIMLALHSSELMPGCSPIFKNKKDIEKLYDDLNELFSYLMDVFQSATLSEYHRNYKEIE
jgi:hypothetical protein